MQSAPVLGKLLVENTTTQFATVTIDGDKGSINVGGLAPSSATSPGTGYNGQLSVTSGEGTENAAITGSSVGGLLLLNYHDGKHCLALGRGFNADPGPTLFMLNNEKETVALYGLTGLLRLGSGGAEGELALFGSSPTSTDPHQAVIDLRASDATIRAGLAGADGHVLVLGDDGKVKVSIASVKESAGTEGELALFSSSATSSDPHQAVVHLRASDATIRAGLAGVLDGKVLVSSKDGKSTITLEGSSGDIILSNADCAEEFDVFEPEQIQPGAVMVFDDDGKIRKSNRAYDRKVAGIISGAGDYKPGIVLDRRTSSETRMPIALFGKVYCNVDAEAAPIEVGDLLTTSDTPGHAMKACDSLKAFGAVLGKALRPLASGRGLIPVLVAMQ